MATSRSILVIACAYLAVCALAVRKRSVAKVRGVETGAAEPSVWCAAVSGNGGNWASTIGFLSEALNVFLDESASPGTEVDLRCVTGGSSGSATSLLVRNVITNANLGTEVNGKVSIEHARLIAKSLNLLAMAVDLSGGALARTVEYLGRTEVKWRQDGESWEKSATAVGTEGSQMQFKQGLVVAKFMPKEWLELKAEDMISSSNFDQNVLRKVAKKLGIVTVVDVPDLNVTDLEGQQLTRVLTNVASGVKSLATNFVGGQIIKNPLTMLSDAMHHHKSLIDSFDHLMQEDVGDGIIAVTFASQVPPGVQNPVAEYPSVRVLALMSQGTAEAILRSPEYQNSLRACARTADDEDCMHANRHILAVVENLEPMLKFGTMEPKFQKPYVGTLADMGVTMSFDPAGMGDNVSWTLTPASTDFEKDKYYYILGGFVDRGHSVSLLKYYRQGLGDETRTSYAMFGKNVDPTTAIKAVKEELTHTGEADADANWDDYKRWASFRPQPAPPNTIVDGYCNWDCGAGIPANLRGASWKLRLHGVAVARIAFKNEARIFDPMADCESA